MARLTVSFSLGYGPQPDRHNEGEEFPMWEPRNAGEPTLIERPRASDESDSMIGGILPNTLPIGDASIWRIRELGSGPFVRFIALDVPVDPVRIERRLIDGVLTLRLPKRK